MNSRWDICILADDSPAPLDHQTFHQTFQTLQRVHGEQRKSVLRSLAINEQQADINFFALTVEE